MLLPQIVLSFAAPLASLFDPKGPQQLPLAPHLSRSSFTPLLPPAIPLAVKSVYVNAVLPTGGDQGSRGYLAGSWPRHWPVSYPGSAKSYNLGWSGMVNVDGKSYVFLGDPEIDFHGTKPPVATQTAFLYTASRSIFTFDAGGVDFNVTFFSPVTPHDLVRMSLPLSYMSVDVDPAALRKQIGRAHV